MESQPEVVIDTGLTPYQIYAKVADNTVRGVITAVLGTAFLWILNGWWPLGAKIGFWLAALLTAWDALQSAIGFGSQVLIIISGNRRPGERWMIAGTIVRVGNSVVLIALLLFLHKHIWR